MTTDKTFTPEDALRMLDIAKRQAKVPLSNFTVGAIAVGQSGKIFSGCNLEFAGRGFSATVHAEQYAVVAALKAKEYSLTTLWVSEVPCGHCRQWLLELGEPDLPIHILSKDQFLLTTLAELLPYPFTLAHQGVKLLQRPQSPQTSGNIEQMAHWIAQQSYCPYTHSKAGIVFECHGGQYMTGWPIESSAYNPSLSPLQMALIELHQHSLKVSDIERIRLVESPTAVIPYQPELKAFLKANDGFLHPHLDCAVRPLS